MFSKKTIDKLREKSGMKPCTNKDDLLALHTAPSHDPRAKCRNCGATVKDIKAALKAHAEANLLKRFGGNK